MQWLHARWFPWWAISLRNMWLYPVRSVLFYCWGGPRVLHKSGGWRALRRWLDASKFMLSTWRMHVCVYVHAYTWHVHACIHIMYTCVHIESYVVIRTRCILCIMDRLCSSVYLHVVIRLCCQHTCVCVCINMFVYIHSLHTSHKFDENTMIQNPQSRATQCTYARKNSWICMYSCWQDSRKLQKFKSESLTWSLVSVCTSTHYHMHTCTYTHACIHACTLAKR
jgi:hypothetical protein